MIINSYGDVDSVRLVSNISIVLIKMNDLEKDAEKLKNIFDKFPGNSPVEIFVNIMDYNQICHKWNNC